MSGSQFLIVYEPWHRRTTSIQKFDDSATAMSEYAKLSKHFIDQGDLETHVVLLAAKSIDTLKVTHPRYFGSDEDELVPSLETIHERAAALTTARRRP